MFRVLMFYLFMILKLIYTIGLKYKLNDVQELLIGFEI